MVSSNAFNYINVLNKAAGASWIRNEVIANNIANVDTPNYKRSDVEFQGILMEKLKGTSGTLNQKLASAKFDEVEPIIYKDYSGLSYRLDGNNVDIDTESANLAKNQIRYNAIIDSMTQEFNRLNTVLKGL